MPLSRFFPLDEFKRSSTFPASANRDMAELETGPHTGDCAEKNNVTQSSPAKRKAPAAGGIRAFFAKRSKPDGTGAEEGTTKEKPILVVLPGASGKCAKDFYEIFLPSLSNHFVIREWKEGWKGWNTSKNAVRVVDAMCPKEEDAAPWYLLGASFGNRVAVSIVVDALTPVQPSLILTGYPLYGPNGKDDRVKHFQSLPAGAKVLCISGEKDEFLNKNVPAPHVKGSALLNEVISGTACNATTTVQMVPKGTHGCFPGAKGLYCSQYLVF